MQTNVAKGCVTHGNNMLFYYIWTENKFSCSRIYNSTYNINKFMKKKNTKYKIQNIVFYGKY